MAPRVPPPPAPDRCLVCGGRAFTQVRVLWPALIATWGISEEETAYIDVQQGTSCDSCGSNVRSIALAAAIMRWREFPGLFTEFVHDPRQAALRVIELNEAGALHPLLERLPGHHFGAYPGVDMRQLPFADGAFDLVVHSDTLEHVTDPARGLAECRRVLSPVGAAVFTVPTVLGRLSRSRAGLEPSYHGAAHVEEPHLMVHTEFGADLWTMVLAAGFGSCELVPFCFPAGLAIIARR